MKLYIRFFSILMLVISLTVSSCLKDKDYDNGTFQSVHPTGQPIKVVEVKLTGTNTTNVLSLSFDLSSNDTVVNLIPINLATKDPAPQDLHVTLTQDDQIVKDYNANNTDTTVTPTNPNPTGKIVDYQVPTLFTLVSPTVIIPKGSHTGYLQIKFKPSDFVGVTYALGYKISKIDEPGYVISGNNGSGMVVINIKNQYDGSYHASGVRVHPVLGPFPFSYDANLSTTSINSVQGPVLADLAENLNITINPDNTVSLSSARTVFLTAGKDNKYDPATKTFTLNYYYNTAAPRVISETLVRNP